MKWLLHCSKNKSAHLSVHCKVYIYTRGSQSNPVIFILFLHQTWLGFSNTYRTWSRHCTSSYSFAARRHLFLNIRAARTRASTQCLPSDSPYAAITRNTPRWKVENHWVYSLGTLSLSPWLVFDKNNCKRPRENIATLIGGHHATVYHDEQAVDAFNRHRPREFPLFSFSFEHSRWNISRSGQH